MLDDMISIELNISNHPSTKGLEDYIHYLRTIFLSHGYSMILTNLKVNRHHKTSQESDSKIVLNVEFAETFDAYQNVDSTKTFLVGTEYIGESGFNQFLEKDKVLDKLMNKIPIELLYRYLCVARAGGFRRQRKLRILLKAIRLVYLCPRLTIALLNNACKGYSIYEFGYRISLNLRYRNFIRHKDSCKGLIVASKALYDNYTKMLGHSANIVYLPPLLPVTMIKQTESRDINIFFSGRLTNYRKEVFSRLSDCLEITDIRAVDINVNDTYSRNVMLRPIASKTKESDLTHELYIGQSKDWLYASPMRTYRSICMGYIPVSDKLYKDELFDVSILPVIDNYESLLQKLEKYNLWAGKQISTGVSRIINE